MRSDAEWPAARALFNARTSSSPSRIVVEMRRAIQAPYTPQQGSQPPFRTGSLTRQRPRGRPPRPRPARSRDTPPGRRPAARRRRRGTPGATESRAPSRRAPAWGRPARACRSAARPAGAGRPRRPVPGPAQRGAHARREPRAPQDEPRARERLPLPEVAVLRIVALERGDARREAAPLAAGPEPEVHGERDAGGRDVAERAGQALDGEAVEPRGVDRVAAVGPALVPRHHEQVEVRARDELAAAELTEPHDDHGDEPALRVARDAVAG